MEPYILNLAFPDSIETQRLTIRNARPGDGQEFNAAILESLEGLQTWLGIFRDQPPTVAESEAMVRERYASFVTRQYLLFFCLLKGTNTIVVTINLRPTWDVPSFEIGY